MVRNGLPHCHQNPNSLWSFMEQEGALDTHRQTDSMLRPEHPQTNSMLRPGHPQTNSMLRPGHPQTACFADEETKT